MASLIARKNVLSTDYYTYQNLPPGAYIRLLDISPGFKGEAISCSLHVTGLDQVPAYTALSYFWGEPVFVHRVLCDGKEVKVTKVGDRVILEPLATERPQSIWEVIDALGDEPFMAQGREQPPIALDPSVSFDE